MIIKQSKRLRTGLMLGAALILMAVPEAKAGFEWTPPANVQQAPPVVAAPAPAVQAENLDQPKIMPFPMQETAMDVEEQMVVPVDEPEIFIEEKTRMSAPVAAAPAMAANPFASAPPPMAVQTVPSSNIMMPAEKVSYEHAQGFGTDIPLVLAMRQIVPPEFSYSFDPDINPGQRISWNGGKPWNEVLEDALRPLEMRVLISERTVWVRQTWGEADDMMPEAAMTDVASASMVSPIMPAPPPVEPMMAMQSPPMMPVPMGQPAPMMMPEPSSREPMPIPMATSIFDHDDAVAPQSYPRRKNPAMLMSDGEVEEDVMARKEQAPTPLMPSYLPGNPNLVAPGVVPSPPEPIMQPDMAPFPAPLMKADKADEMMHSDMAATHMSAPAMAPTNMAGPGAVLDPFEIRFWHAEPGESLKSLLHRWAETANVAIMWNAGHDYMIPMPVRMHGTFADAVTHVLMTYNAADPRPLGRLHPNLPDGPSVLIVENFSSATN